MINFTLNNLELEVPDGTTVLQAARANGITIPTLCDHPDLTPYGGCRLCVVEVEGFRTIQASCTLPAGNGMVVHTNTPALQESRQFVLSMLFSERNHFCPFCQVSGGDCELQNSAYDQGMTHWPIQPQWNTFPVDTSHPYYVLDNNRCILCRRCVRACGEMVGNFTLAIDVIAEWYPTGQTLTGPARTATITVPAKGQRFTAEAPVTLFQASETRGGLILRSSSPFKAQVRTYNDQRAVYAAVARNLIWHEADEAASDEYGLPRFLEGTLQRVVGGPISLETANHPNYKALIDTLELATVDSLAYKNAVLATFEALIDLIEPHETA